MATETLRINITADNKAAITGISGVKNSVNELKDKIAEYESKAFNSVSLEKVRKYNAQIQLLQADVKALTNAGKDGFDKFGNAIKTAMEPSSNGLTKAFSGLRSIAYILPGIGIAGIFNLAFEAIGKAADGLGIFAKKEDEAATAAKAFNDELVKQREGAEGEVSHLKALESVASNTNVAMKERLQAVKEIRDQYPAYFKDLSNEQILTGNIKVATDLLTEAIYKRAEARAREADIAKKATEVFRNQQQIEMLDLEISKQKKLASDRSVLKKVGTSGGVNDISGSDIQYQSESKLRDLQIERNQLYLQTEGIKIDVEKDQNRINKLQGETIKLDETETKAKKEKVSVFEQMLDKLAHIQDEYSRRIIDNTEYNKKSISVIDEESKHLKLNSDEYKKAILLRDQFYQQNKDKSNPLTRFVIATGREFSGEQITTPKHLSATDNAAVNSASETSLTKKKADLEEFNKTMSQSATLASIGAAAFSTMFDAMAKGESIGEAIANVFKDLVKQLAISVAKAITFAVILNVISGGAYSIGKIFVGALGGNMTGKGYANGGISTGSKSGHMELLHGTEAILTPSQFSGLFNAGVQTGQMSGSNSGSQHIEISGRISGQDIWLSKQRTDFQRSLTT